MLLFFYLVVFLTVKGTWRNVHFAKSPSLCWLLGNLSSCRTSCLSLRGKKTTWLSRNRGRVTAHVLGVVGTCSEVKSLHWCLFWFKHLTIFNLKFVCVQPPREKVIAAQAIPHGQHQRTLEISDLMTSPPMYKLWFSVSAQCKCIHFVSAELKVQRLSGAAQRPLTVRLLTDEQCQRLVNLPPVIEFRSRPKPWTLLIILFFPVELLLNRFDLWSFQPSLIETILKRKCQYVNFSAVSTICKLVIISLLLF